MPPKKKLKLKPDDNQSVITNIFKRTTTCSSSTSASKSANTSIIENKNSESTENGGSTGVGKEPEKEQSNKKERHFKESWKTIFPWLELRDGKMFCTVCVQSKIANNSFTTVIVFYFRKNK